MEKLLLLLAGLMFVASMVAITEARGRPEAKRRAHRRHESRRSTSRVHRAAHGMIVAQLADARADRIVVGGRALWLRDGESCAYTVGTPVRVVYTVVDGRRLVDGIMVVARAD
jgi:hypothetical protein